jgi:ADP-ribosylglycohydrolase
MALIMARSLLKHKGLNPDDLMKDFLAWKESKECFDIGNTISAALHRFKRSGDPYQGLDDNDFSGNGSIMRLYPSVIWTLAQPSTEAFKLVWDCSRLTHASELVRIETQKMFTFIRRCFTLDRFTSKADLIEGMTYPLEPLSTGFVVDTFDAALWGFMESDSFEEGLLKIVNLGGDADTIGAVYGQIAGSWYGVDGLPFRFLNILEPREEIKELTEKLLKL